MQCSRVVGGMLATLLCVLATIPVAWGQEATPAPAEWTDVEKETFLHTAEILSLETIGIGTTGTQRGTLSADSATHAAHIQNIDIFRRGVTKLNGGGFEFNFRDSYKFNIAGYRLDRLLGLNMVPASVERTVRRNPSAVTWWVDNVQMAELDRFNNRIEPPNVEAWNDQMNNARIFTELIYNTDPNLGNFLITNDWKLHLIDFTRAFRTFDRLREPSNIEPRIVRRLYEGLRGLEETRLEEAMDGLLDDDMIDGILARRDLILEFLDGQIAEQGEAAVIWDVPGR